MPSSVEIAITKWRKKLDPRMVSLLILIVFAGTILFAGQMTKNFKNEKQLSENAYNRAFYDMTGYVKNVEVLLSKAMITSTPTQSAKTLADLWRQANLAQENLAHLPVDQSVLGNTQKFLSQLSDYSYSLMRQTLNGEKINDEQYDTINKMEISAKALAINLDKIYESLSNGRLKWDEVRKLGNKVLTEEGLAVEITNIKNIGKQFKDYEGLIYDGAFSDHILELEPKGLEDKTVSTDEAKEVIYKMLDREKLKYLNFTGEVGGRIDTYSFEGALKEKNNIINIDVTKKGGKVLLMLSDRKVENVNISMDDAKKIGLEFLKNMGIENMKDTYYITEGNMATINYAYLQDDIIVYSDLIKVKIALDDGEVCSVETQGYIFNHEERKKLQPKITKEQAKAKINKGLKIESEGMAIIPTESKDEVLTYEFKGKIDKRNFLIYINAETGEEERIFLIIETPNGVLTM